MEKADHGRRRHVSSPGNLPSFWGGGSGVEISLVSEPSPEEIRSAFCGECLPFLACRYREEGPGPNVGSHAKRALILRCVFSGLYFLCKKRQPGARHGGIGRKQKAIISGESTMAAGQVGKVPGAPPRNPAVARSRGATGRGGIVPEKNERQILVLPKSCFCSFEHNLHPPDVYWTCPSVTSSNTV